jgi:hypothetical protein
MSDYDKPFVIEEILDETKSEDTTARKVKVIPHKRGEGESEIRTYWDASDGSEIRVKDAEGGVFFVKTRKFDAKFSEAIEETEAEKLMQAYSKAGFELPES